MSAEERSRSTLSVRSSKFPMGHKKVRSLPPMSKGRRRHSSVSLNRGQQHQQQVEKSKSLGLMEQDRQRIIGSPAPQAFRDAISEKMLKSRKKNRNGEFPTITLSMAEDDDDLSDYEEYGIQHDSIISVGQVGGALNSSRNSRSVSRRSSFSDSFNQYSLQSLGNAVEQYQRTQSRESQISNSLTPPPRVISMKDQSGQEIVTEWKAEMKSGPSTPNTEDERLSADSRRQKKKSKSNLPSLGSSYSNLNDIPSKYPTLEPIKGKSRKKHH